MRGLTTSSRTKVQPPYRAVTFWFDLERPHRRTQDAEIGRTSTGNSTVH